MQWSEFQDTADRLAQGATEEDWRSATSRSYYAIFHYFHEFLLVNGLNIGQGGQSHFNLYSGLFNCGCAGIAPIARRIDALRQSRRDADCDLHHATRPPLALRCVREGRKVVADFQAAVAKLAPSQVAAGARAHLQAIGKLPRSP